MSSPSIDDLKCQSAFRVLDIPSLERLTLAGRLEHYRRNDVLFSPDDRADRLMLILEGAVKSTVTAANQREVILEILGPGDIVGEDAVSEERRITGASVMRESTMATFQANAILPLCSENPAFACAWLKYGLGLKRRLQERVAELAYGNIEDRLFRMLHHLALYHGATTKKGNTILRFPLTHQEMANLIGATRETTTLAVGRLRASGAISFLERKIVLKDRVQTEALADERVG
jgi:CRP/FNR family transcriptional regulator, cyclic AMP receptor protein